MKRTKITVYFLIVVVLAFMTDFSSAAFDFQPFAPGTMGTEKFRIPSAYSLSDGNVLFTADMRNTTGQDSPENIDTLTALFDGENFDYTVVNSFNDAPLGVSSTECASFIDSAVVQSKETGRVFILTTAYPTGLGILSGEKGSGFKDGRLVLTDNGGSRDKKDYKYIVGDFEDGFASVTGTEYSVDEDYNLYKIGEPLFAEQLETGEKVKQNVFFVSSELSVFPTSYLTLRFSDDGGRTWSGLKLLNGLKSDDESFLGTCPGRGAVTTVDGKERILFCVYNHSSTKENTSVIFSDDGGETWKRGASLKNSLLSGKSSEAQIINCPDGSLRIFARNKSKFITTAQSFDGGETWGKLKADTDLYCTKNCMASFINTSKRINGKKVVLGSFARGGKDRKDGVIATGLMDEKGRIDWIERYHINSGFFAYSCLTELPDGRIACLFEDDPFGITLGIFDIDENGIISSVDGNDIEYEENDGFGIKLLRIFTDLFSF